MGKTRFLWSTRAEADAFVCGVEHVNDSAIEVDSVTERAKYVVVLVIDEDRRGNTTIDERRPAERPARKPRPKPTAPSVE